MIGVELDLEVPKLISAGYEHGLLMVGSGQSVLRVIPPLIAENQHVDLLVERLSEILTEV